MQTTKFLTYDDHAYLKRLQKRFHNRIQKLDDNYTPYDLSNDKEKNIIDKLVSVTDKAFDNKLDPVQQKKKRMNTCQVGTSKVEVHAPQHVHVEYVYANKKLQTKLSE